MAFLVILTGLFVLYALINYTRPRTYLGDQVLKDLRGLLTRLKDHAYLLKAGGETNEVALLVAVFGVGALSTDTFPFVRKIFPNYGSSCGGGCGGCGS